MNIFFPRLVGAFYWENAPRCFFCLLLGLSNTVLSAQSNVFSSNLPIVVINTGGANIPDEPKVKAHMGIVDNGPGQTNYSNGTFNGYDGSIGIELRGSTSMFYDKKPYGIELRDAAGQEVDAPLLGMPAESDFALVSPLNDKTLMRDVLAHYLARTSLPWSPRTRYCEVVINGQYMGVYVLIETIKRGKDRVDISKLKATDISGDQLTGGYMLRMDKYGASPGSVGGNWASRYPPFPGGWQTTWFQYDYPKEEDIAREQEQYIQKYINDFEDMLQRGDFSKHYADWLDMDSWAAYTLVQELSKNTDGYRLSAYFYKDRDSVDRRIKMGPAWDFNISFGIGDYCDGASPYGWGKDFNLVCPGDGWVIHFWWDRLWRDDTFRHHMANRWQALRAGPWSDAKLFGAVDSIANLLQGPQARNFARWPVLGRYVWPNSFIGITYDSEVTFLKTWLRDRLGWLDRGYKAMITPIEPPRPEAPPFELFPNPTDGKLFFKTNRSGSITQRFDVRLYDNSGRLVLRQLVEGAGTVPLDISDRKFPTGVYFYKILDDWGEIYRGKIVFQ